MSQTRTLPLLGDDGKPPLPTMRDVARSFKEAGLDGLPSAVQRADHASYQEVRCRSALNRVRGMPFKWTLNPYRGCTHGCHYCFARRYQSQLEMGAGDDFSSVILVKVNFPEVLRRELVRGTAVRDLVALGTATDPYQPAEGHYRLTRRSLQALVDHPTPVALVTKGPLVVRDIDLLVELSRRAPSTVSVSATRLGGADAGIRCSVAGCVLKRAIMPRPENGFREHETVLSAERLTDHEEYSAQKSQEQRRLERVPH